MDPDPRRPTERALFVRAGLDPEQALARLTRVGWWPEDGPSQETLALLVEVGDTAGPSDALAVVTDLAEAHPSVFAEMVADDAWRRRVLAVAGTSRPLGDLLAQHPEATRSLRAPGEIWAADVATRVRAAIEAEPVEDEELQAAAIARIRRRATAGIAARDLADDLDVTQVAYELAALAEGVMAGTLAALHKRVSGGTPAARIAVIGMGKLGGHELNYISDVDVVFVHEATGDDEEAARQESRDVLEGMLRLLNASTTMGRAYEVDPTLRPEGRDGPLSRTVESFVAYWDRWAKTWEFQALIKARPVAGDLALGQALLDAAEPFVWPDALATGVVQEIQRMKGRVESKPEVKRDGARQVKLGPGGLRDIEFSVQLLQLVHGRADRTLRGTGTLAALAALARGGYVGEADADTFRSAYTRLRAIEHRLQLAHERRTHTIPDDEGKQEWLARSLGYRPQSGEPARAQFLADLRVLQADVRELHTKLFYRPLLELQASVPAEDGELTLAARGLSESAARVRLEALGFNDTKGALRDVRMLTTGLSRRARILTGVLPAMLHVLAESPDPDTGLRTFGKLVEAHGRDSKLIGHLRDHPPAAELLAKVLGTSEVAGELLLLLPAGTRHLVERDGLVGARDRERLISLALKQLTWQRDLERSAAALRRFKRSELLRIVFRDLAGEASVGTVGEELTALAEACLEAGLAAVIDEVRGDGDLPARIAVIGMGKLGGRELHYASDLDVMFVHEAFDGVDEAEASRFATIVAERMISVLSAITAEGTAFEVDADLRPEGRDGPLTRSLASYREYHERWAERWERQALLRARLVAGDRDLGQRFTDMARPLAYPAEFTHADEVAMRKMKARLERERIRRKVDPKSHIKLGPGGLSDVEWTVQLLQTRHGASHPSVRAPGTLAALDGLQDDDLIETRDARVLRDGYRSLSATRNRLYLLRQRNVDVLPSSADVQERLARSLGYGRGGRQDFEADHLRHTRRVRAVVHRLFYETEEYT